GIGGLPFVRKFFEAQQRLDPCNQFLGQDWLVKKIIGAGLDAANLVGAVAESGDENEWYEARRRILFQRAAQFISGAAGHHHVGKNQIRQLAADFRLRLLRVGGGDHLVSPDREQLAHQPRNAGLVIDHQDSGGAPAGNKIAHIHSRACLVRSRISGGSCPGVSSCIGERPQARGNWQAHTVIVYSELILPPFFYFRLSRASSGRSWTLSCGPKFPFRHSRKEFVTGNLASPRASCLISLHAMQSLAAKHPAGLSSFRNSNSPDSSGRCRQSTRHHLW